MDSGKSLREMLEGKPSLAVKVMIKGLDNPPPNFHFDMDSFGFVREDECMGCAATVALQEITGHRFTLDEIAGTGPRGSALGLDFGDVEQFENAVDELRLGAEDKLGEFCEVKMPCPNYRLIELHKYVNWPDIRSRYIKYQKQLEEAGL